MSSGLPRLCLQLICSLGQVTIFGPERAHPGSVSGQDLFSALEYSLLCSWRQWDLFGTRSVNDVLHGQGAHEAVSCLGDTLVV